MISNYKLLISGIVSRPIGFLSTQSIDGKTENLSPMSYFQAVDHDPLMFIVGFSAQAGRPQDTCRNLKETGECVINVVSESMMPALNATSVDAPYGVSEWAISGLHQAPSTTVKPARVKGFVFSIEGRLTDLKELASLAVIEATRFWVREDAINDDLSQIDLSVLRHVA
jgi:flavin reductase (DIM6/NTAB) family NADH-FMN oxidoreductase RutF